jgi:general secretion pathway protein G
MVIQTYSLARYNAQVTAANEPIQSAGLYDFNGNGVADAPYILEGYQCLVFFLGGVPSFKVETTALPVGGLVSDFGMTGWGNLPANPFQITTLVNTSTTPYTYTTVVPAPSRTPPFFEFKGDRLIVPANSLSGIPAYYDPLGDPLDPETTNFYAYFSAYGNSAYDPNDCNLYTVKTSPISANRPLPPYITPTLPGFMENDDVNSRMLYAPSLMFSNGTTTTDFSNNTSLVTKSTAPNPYTSTPSYRMSGAGVVKPTYLNPQSYQIISAGRDGLYGWGGQFIANATESTLPLDLDPSTTPFFPVTVDGTIRNRERDNLTNFKNGSLE